MAKDVSHRTPAFSNFESLFDKSKSGVVIMVALALALAPPQFAFGQTTQQEQQEQQQREEQQREQQQREEQQREEQAREQQQREEQAREEQQRQQQQREEQQREEQRREQQQREEQQREEQQREEQAREQQQREEQAREEQQRQQQQREEQQREEQQREQQAREEQQREQQEQQQREQQAREQQQRDEQQRQEQERQQQTPGTPVDSSTRASPSVNSQVSGAIPAGSQVSNDKTRTPTRTQALEPNGRINTAASERENTPSKSQDLRPPASALPHRPCDKEPCTEPGPKPVSPDLRAKLCKGGPCPVCAAGQSPGKDNSCVSAALAKKATAPPKPSVVLPQACPAGQIWNGVQCATVGPQQCLPGQANVGALCQTDCTIATAGAQNYIQLLRMARQDKDNACTQNPTGDECRNQGITYEMRLNEYRNYLGGVPTGCTLPDPISI